MKNKIRKIIDIIMTILFIVLMGYHITGNELHEILGVTTFIFFIIHNILNIMWYKTIFKGKISFYKTFQVMVNLLLFLAMLGMMISGIMISSHVFTFLNVPTTMLGRDLHMISTSWGFVLMSVHLGMHLKVILKKFNKKLKNSMFEYIYYLVIFIIMIYGLYAFIDTTMWKDMFLLTHFKFFDYEQSPYLFYLGQFAILVFISYVVYIGMSFKKSSLRKS